MVRFVNKSHQLEPIRLHGSPVISKWVELTLITRALNKTSIDKHQTARGLYSIAKLHVPTLLHDRYERDNIYQNVIHLLTSKTENSYYKKPS